MQIGTGNLIGEDDVIKNSTTLGSKVDTFYTTSVSCFSQSAEAFSIQAEDFRKFVMQTDMDTWHLLEKQAC